MPVDSAMQAAIADTWETLRLRVNNYRVTAFASLALAAAILIAAIWLRTPWVLALGLGFFPLGAVFVWRDQSAVFEWEERILMAWAESGRLARARAEAGPNSESFPKSDFVMGIFIPAIANQPHRLSGSLKSMVANLPADPDYLPPPKERVFAARKSFYARRMLQDYRLRSRLLRYSLILLMPLDLAVFMHGFRSIALWVTPVIALLMIAGFLIAPLAWGRYRNACATLKPESDPPSERTAIDSKLDEGPESVAALDMRGIPTWIRNRLDPKSISPSN